MSDMLTSRLEHVLQQAEIFQVFIQISLRVHGSVVG
jgi:hypothetical protein